MKIITIKNLKRNVYSPFLKLINIFLISFLCPILEALLDIFIDKIEKEGKNEKNEKKYQFLLVLILSFNYTSGGLLYFFNILRVKTKVKKIIYSRTESSIEFIYNSNYDNLISNKTGLKIIIILFFMPILMSIIIIVKEDYESNKILDSIIIYLILIPLLSKLILKEKIYNHHILSLIISIIASVLILVPTIQVLEKNDILLIVIELFTSNIHCLILVLIKYLTDKYYISPYKILLFISIGSTILIIISNIIYSLIVYGNLSFLINSFYFPNTLDFCFYIIMLIILGFLF